MKTENVKKSGRTSRTKHIGLVRNDSYLEPFEEAIKVRHDHALWKLGCLTKNGKTKLSDFANGHNYYGLHKLKRGWVFREWAPNATRLFLVGDFNKWQENEKYEAHRIEGTGNWELKLKEKDLKHGDLYKMHVYWEGGFGERIASYYGTSDMKVLVGGVKKGLYDRYDVEQLLSDNRLLDEQIVEDVARILN